MDVPFRPSSVLQLQFLLILFCFSVFESLGKKPSYSIPAFAGGFGASSSAKKSPKNKSKKSRGRKGGVGFGLEGSESTSGAVQQKTVSTPEGVANDGPVLDKWGLPPPTEEDIFPPMPPGTELVGVDDASDGVSLQTIREALKEHIELSLDRFDEDGVEKTPRNVDHPMRIRLLHKSPPGKLIVDACWDASMFSHPVGCIVRLGAASTAKFLCSSS